MVLKLLMCEVCVIIGISKIEFFNFSGSERVKNLKVALRLCRPLRRIVTDIRLGKMGRGACGNPDPFYNVRINSYYTFKKYMV